MTEIDREKTLSQFTSELNRSTPRRQSGGDAAEFEWEEVAFLAEGLAFGQRALRAATDKVTERYDLGPRGAWILNVLSHGISYPLELASIFCVGRSLITAELARLTEARLVDSRPGKDDRRKTELTLTPLGRSASDEIRKEFLQIVRRRMSGFDAKEVRLVAEALRALSQEPNAAPE